MGKVRTYKQFIEEVTELEPIVGKIVFKGKYSGIRKKILAEVEYGELMVTPASILKGIKPSITTAINRTEFFSNMLKNIQPEIYDSIKIKGEYINSSTKILIENKYGELLCTPDGLLQGCAPSILSATDKDLYFSAMLKDIHPENFAKIKIKGKYKGATTKMLVENKRGYCMMTPSALIGGSLPTIEVAVNPHEYFLNILREVNPKALDLTFITEYKNVRKEIIVRDKYGETAVLPNTLRNGGFSGIQTAINKENYFTKMLEDKNPNVLKEFSVVKYYSSDKILMNGKYGEVIASTSTLLRGHIPTILTAVNPTKYWVNEAKEIHGDLYDYSKVKYIGSKIKVYVICRIHGGFWVTPNGHLSSRKACPKCNASKGERRVSNNLDKNDIKYESEYTFKDCKHKALLPFDFYLPDHNILIEYQGEQHYEPVNFGGISNEKALENFKVGQYRDAIKLKYAETKNITLLRIPYWDFDNIETILAKELNLSD